VGLERARNQIMVRSLCVQEVPSQRLEFAALDLYAFGRVRSREELMAGVAAVRPVDVREAVARMQGAGAAVALAGKIARGAEERIVRLVAKLGG
jgi:hypothetical protein